MGQSRWWEQEIPMEGTIQKGELLTYNLTELIKPESYLVRLTPITRYGEGDSTERIITYSGRPSRFLSSNQEQVYKHCLSSLCAGFTRTAVCNTAADLWGSHLCTAQARDSVSGWVWNKPLSSSCSLVDLLHDLNAATLHVLYIEGKTLKYKESREKTQQWTRCVLGASGTTTSRAPPCLML